MYKIGFRTAKGGKLGFDGPYSSVESAEVCLTRWGYVKRPGLHTWRHRTTGQTARILVVL